MKAPQGDIGFTQLTPENLRTRLDASTGRANSAALASVVAGSLMLDSKGSILACSENVAQLCGVESEDMTDHPVRTFLPEVPLDACTEGYNVAFVAFCSATGRAETLNVATANGDAVQVEVCFSLLRVESRYLFRLQLRWTDNASVSPITRLRLRRLPVTATPGARSGRHRVTRVRQ
jgi:PAS domain-containing protein